VASNPTIANFLDNAETSAPSKEPTITRLAGQGWPLVDHGIENASMDFITGLPWKDQFAAKST
jgi:hypothetical protein